MVTKRKTKSRRDLVARLKPAPRLRTVTINKLSQLRVGDRVVYRDEMNREHVGTVSSLDFAHGAVIAQSPDGLCNQRVTARNFVGIEARTARNITEGNAPTTSRGHGS
jgi:hypothetical protein